MLKMLNPKLSLRRIRLSLFAGLMLFLLQPLQAQYTMHEVGVAAGGGFAAFPNEAQALNGAGFNANAFFTHYLCGKAYGFHLQAGANAFLPSTQGGEAFLSPQLAGNTRFLIGGAELGAYFKVRLRDYHRPREVALHIGPKVNFPLLARFNSDYAAAALRPNTDKFGPVQVGAHVSLQFRRPAPEKKSWFFEPGVDYYFMSGWKNDPAGSVKTAYIYLNFGYALWDQRG